MDPVAQLVVEIAGILLLGALGEFIFARTRVPGRGLAGGRRHSRRPDIRSYPVRAS